MSEGLSRIEARMAYLRTLVGETNSGGGKQFAAALNEVKTESAAPTQEEFSPTPFVPLPSSTPTPNSTPARAARATPEALQPIIQEAAVRTGLSPDLIDAVIRTESGYRTNAVSRVGAQGLMQLMPGTARSLGVTNPMDARQNVMGGSEYLSKQIARFGSVEKALAAYNAGPGAVAKFGGIPPYAETQRYVRKVLSHVGGPLGPKGEAQ
jgi:soluble lytic murein transglycosylase-like protein